MKNTVLGLDLGPNSIGWSLINLNEEEESSNTSEIIDTGVRIFQETEEKKGKKKVSKNLARRTKRGARRTIARRVRRHRLLQGILRQASLLPDDDRQLADLLTIGELGCNPYAFRKKGLDERLEPYEFGRTLCHLNQRRGFQSNRKEGAKKKEDTEYKKMMAELAQAIETSGCRTLGEYLANLPKDESKRRKHTTRKMYENEFELLWDAQAKYHPDILTSGLKVCCYKAIFHQRSFKTPHKHIGWCTLEPSRKRCQRKTLLAQRARIWQDINNLRRLDPQTYDEIELTPEQKQTLFEMFESKKEVSFDQMRTKKLKLHENESFNLESENKKKLKGNTTFAAIKSAMGAKAWNDLASEQRESLAEDLITAESNQVEGLLRRLTGHWSFDEETARKLAYAHLEEGYARLSAKALRKILPHLEKGLRYDQACEEAGYNHSDRQLNDADISRLLGEIRNPIVTKALRQTTKVVHAIARMHGRPGQIVIEMARDLKLSGKRKEDADKKRYRNERENEKARTILENEFGMTPRRADIIKYKLWEECKHVCPYTGQVIEREMLFSPDVDVEHIIPYSRSLIDSYMNKTLCMAVENRLHKRNRTPWEAYGHDTVLWEAMLQRIKSFPRAKRMNFTKRKLDDDFVSRQLNDTRYICTAVKDFFKAQGYEVRVSKGQATALLRKKWNVEGILGRREDGKKSRDDHRHHAIDAIVTACTTQGMLQRISRLSAKLPTGTRIRDRKFSPPAPWTGFDMDVEQAISKIIVSHQPQRGIRGALHKEEAYGLRATPEKNGKRDFVHRVKVDDLTDNQASNIIDEHVKQLVRTYRARSKELKQVLKQARRGFDNARRDALQEELKLLAENLKHKDGKTPIKTVRVHEWKKVESMYGVVDVSGKPYKYYCMRNNHHVEIIRNKATGKHEGRFVTMMEAAKRARRDHKDIVQRDHGTEWEFVMWLSINDMVEIGNENGKTLYRVQKMTPGEVTLRLHTATTLEFKDQAVRISEKNLRCKKLHVDPIGRVREYIDAKNP
ncbi:MAG: type II CRISPR RNA-guided endonuclease Cas9 [Candidatus Cloacimonetes bacterium]|nr:type II CRISPR RNA-guided endonuclease Cas9 [Candidatus Cloacimonadota bacterium]